MQNITFVDKEERKNFFESPYEPDEKINILSHDEIINEITQKSKLMFDDINDKAYNNLNSYNNISSELIKIENSLNYMDKLSDNNIYSNEYINKVKLLRKTLEELKDYEGNNKINNIIHSETLIIGNDIIKNIYTNNNDNDIVIKKYWAKKKEDRKTFYHNDDKDKPIRAAGIILYKIINNDVELLLIKCKERYEDFGGKVDNNDENVYETISREAAEESNYKLDRESIKERLENNNPIYVEHGKYLLYIIEANEDEKLLLSNDFGDKETYENVDRTVEWLSKDKYLNDVTLNPRLKHKLIYNTIKQLNEKQLNEKQLNEKQLNEKQLNEKQLNEKQLNEKQLNEKQLSFSSLTI
jgi:8-oxo-dGTP pyrophosphatase MutT (NUDIX family)